MTMSLEGFQGRSPDTLTFAERRALAGKWVALELYSPATLPLRKIVATGASARECMGVLRARGLNPAQYEYIPIEAAG